jgi:hypothetical protein
MTLIRTAATVVLLTATARAGELQLEKEKFAQDCAGIFTSFNLKEVVSCGGDLFRAKPLHLTTPASVVPGSGAALGLTYTHEFNPHGYQNSITLAAGSSQRQFWFADAVLNLNRRKLGGEWNTARDRFEILLYSHARGLAQMPFYGIGPRASRSNLADYRERDVRAGVHVFNPLQSWLAVEGTAETLWPDVSGLRMFNTLFNEATAPGITQHQPSFTKYGIALDPRYERGRAEFRYRVGYDYYQDHDTGHYSFRRFRADMLNQFYPEGKKRVAVAGQPNQTETRYDSILYIYGRVTASDASAGHAVPFYLQETLGGSDIDNLPTLRGFQDYRFRGPDLLLIQVQFERRIKGPIGFMVFYDTGKVAVRKSDIDFSNMRHSFGAGLTFWTGEKVVFRAYVGLGSGEGRHNFFGVPDMSGTANHL